MTKQALPTVTALAQMLDAARYTFTLKNNVIPEPPEERAYYRMMERHTLPKVPPLRTTPISTPAGRAADPVRLPINQATLYVQTRLMFEKARSHQEQIAALAFRLSSSISNAFYPQNNTRFQLSILDAQTMALFGKGASHHILANQDIFHEALQTAAKLNDLTPLTALICDSLDLAPPDQTIRAPYRVQPELFHQSDPRYSRYAGKPFTAEDIRSELHASILPPPTRSKAPVREIPAMGMN